MNIFEMVRNARDDREQKRFQQGWDWAAGLILMNAGAAVERHVARIGALEMDPFDQGADSALALARRRGWVNDTAV